MKVKHLISSTVLPLTLMLSASNGFADSSNFNKTQVADIQKIVHDYIVNNPSVLVEASQKLRDEMQAKEEKSAMTAITQNTQDLFRNPNSPVVGNPKGSVTVVEFFDYQCGHCKEMTSILDNLVTSNNQVQVVFKELPIFGGDSEFAARASLASYKIAPAKFFAFHNTLMKASNPLKNDDVLKLANAAGIDANELKQAMKSAEVMNEIKANFALAQKLALAGTPAFIIANTAKSQYKFVPGSMPKEKLDEMIQQVTS